MPLKVDEGNYGGFPTPDYLTLGNAKRGVMTVINPTNTPKDALVQAENTYLYENGQPGSRPGVGWYGNAITTTSRVNPITTINLITNPSFEVDTTGWSLNAGGTGGSLTRTTSEFYTGVASASINGGASGRSVTFSLTGLTAGQYYTVQGRMKATAGETFYLYDTISTSVPAIQVTATGGWDPISRVILATGTSGLVEFGLLSSPGKTYYLDAVMMEEGTAPSNYFDGSFPDTDAIDYSWTGTANASTSERIAYTLIAAQIDGYDYFDFDGEIHLVAVAGGSVYRSTDNAMTWEECTGGTLTPGISTNFNQNGGYLYITNATDPIFRYDGTLTLQAYVALDTPAAPTVTKTGLGATTYKYYYKISAVNQIGFTEASPKKDVSVSLTRDTWDATTNYVSVTGTVDTDATRVDVYLSEDDLSYFYLGSAIPASGSFTFKDDGTAVPVPSTLAPTGDTTQGPKVAELTNVGVRQYGVRDPENRYRIWFTGAGNYSGSFSSAYDGGYLDWQPGGKDYPVKVVDYRSGKGDPIATVFCDSADGQGCILQMSLDTLTIGDISITVPSAYKLPGSRGTSAPLSVVNVLNDYFFYNSQAIYNLGSRAQFLNILSTDEASANIRPTVKEISSNGEDGIAAAYYDAKVLFSVPRGSSVNNCVDLYDTERKAWIPNAFTIGFSKFLPYTDTNGARRLLALKPGDNRLSEISESIKGDYGVPFRVDILTGIYSVSRNRFEFQFSEEAELELSNVQGPINFEILGEERKRGYRVVKQKSFNFTTDANSADSGWDNTQWDEAAWDDTSNVPNVVSDISKKKYFTVQKEMNSIQWRVYTQSLDAKFVIQTLQTWGTVTQAGKPTGWRIR